MSITIDASGLAKISTGDLVRELTNERQRVWRRLNRAHEKFAGLCALKEDLKPYLQPEDYEHIEERLQREINRWQQKHLELSRRCSDERYRQRFGERRFEEMCRERERIHELLFGCRERPWTP